MPNGSVRALIALGLIVIFAIIAVFMGTQLTSVPLTYSNGTYVVVNGTVQFSQPSQALSNFSLQTLTTISTLVVAVASFYFGSRVAQSAAKTAAEGTSTSTITITTDPKDFAEYTSPGPLTIKLTTDPDNESIEWEVDGDIHDSVTYAGKNQYNYTPSDKITKDVVAITFEAAKDSSMQEKFIVHVPTPAKPASQPAAKPGETDPQPGPESGENAQKPSKSK